MNHSVSTMMRNRAAFSFLVLVVLFVATAGAEQPQSSAELLRKQYDEMISYRIVHTFPVRNVTVVRGPATFELIAGEIEMIEPVRGRYHAAVFSGEGVVRYTPPTQTEKDQLRKFTERETLNEPIKWVVLRFSDATAEELLNHTAPPGTPGVPGDGSRKCKEVRKKVLENYSSNLDSRILRDIFSGVGGYFLAYVSGNSNGEFIVEMEPEAEENFSVVQYRNTGTEIVDIWSSISFSSGIMPVGDVVRIPRYDIDLTVDKDGNVNSTNTLEIVALQDSTAAVPLRLSPFMEVTEVADEKGLPCFFVQDVARDRLGAPSLRQSTLDVFLPEPVAKGQAARLRIVLKSKDLIERIPGKKEYSIRDTTGWYPTHGYLRRSESTVTYRFPDDLQLLAVGKKVKEWEENAQKCVTYHQDIPVTYIGFALGDFKHRQDTGDDLPVVDVYSGKSHSGIRPYGDPLENVTRDIASSLRFFQDRLAPYPFSSIRALEIPGMHGQGFPGFLHLSSNTFEDESLSGVEEAFRAHEVSHQWWGHLIGWRTYHDQWLSEAFAEYWGALYADAATLGKKKVMEEILDSWNKDILSRGSVGSRRFGYPKLNSKVTMGSKSGPLSLGYRLYSSRTPVDYKILVYEKGAYVLHMLRMMMRDFNNGSDDRFYAMMKDFATRYSWKEPTTDDFQKVAEDHVGRDLKWFFDQWVHGTDIPRYKFTWSKESGNDGKRVLVFQVEQKEVPDTFQMPVPVRIDFGGNESTVVVLQMDQPSRTFRIEVPKDPQKVEFNYYQSVLCHES